MIINESFGEYRNLERLFYPIAKKYGFSKVVYRKSNMDIALEFKVAGCDSGRTMTILNPFPLKNSSLQALMALSQFDVVGCTGDHSFYEAINLGKIPLHENVPHLFKFHRELSKEAKSLELDTLAGFFATLRADEKSEFLTKGNYSATQPLQINLDFSQIYATLI